MIHQTRARFLLFIVGNIYKLLSIGIAVFSARVWRRCPLKTILSDNVGQVFSQEEVASTYVSEHVQNGTNGRDA